MKGGALSSQLTTLLCLEHSGQELLDGDPVAKEVDTEELLEEVF